MQPEQAIRQILHTLPDLPESIELPAHLFRLLVEQLDLRRAALLLPDYDEEVFVPWAAHGLDATSIHRLRVPSSDLDSVLAESEAGLVWYGDHCHAFAPYFSRREASVLEHLLVFPLVSGGRLVAVLLITDTPYFESHVEHLRIVLAAVGEPAARIVRSSRTSRVDIMRRTIVFKPAEASVVAGRIAGRTPERVRVLLLRLSDVVSQIAASNDHLDSFRVWQDVLRAVAAVFASTASVCDVVEHRALVLMHAASDDDTELLVHHVAATLASLFPEVSSVPVLRTVARAFPDDGDDLNAIVASLL
ncbi:MAG: GAF domain-containing protein [Spirochaetota bacterium]